MAGKRMKVVTIFDGQKEAKDVFAELIADRDNKRRNEGENSELNVEEIQETDYNQGVSS